MVVGFKLHLFRGLALSLLLLLQLEPASAAPTCAANFKDAPEIRQELQTSIEAWRSQRPVGSQLNLAAVRTEVLAQFDRLPNTAKEIFGEAAVLLVLLDTELPIFHNRLKSVFSEIQGLIDATPEPNPQIEQIINQVLKKQLQNRAPAHSIEGRAAGVRTALTTKDTLLGALGFLTLAQSQELLYGQNLENPSPESLIGQYLAKTGAKKLMRSFPKGPGDVSGLPRLVLPVSHQSFEAYKSLFIDPHFLVHTHSPRQGTLYVSHNGKVGSYAKTNSELRQMTSGSLLPHILLSSMEANRTTNFFALGDAGSVAQHPWRLRGDGGTYCARGGYSSCTHWIGNLPIGDRLVESYSFPGRVDRYADAAVPEGTQTAPLRAHNDPSPLVQRVWSAPGHEQLADMLQAQDANLRGEFANPGFLFFVLSGQVSPERVPVVFYWVNDHTQEIQPNFQLDVNAI